MESDPRETVVLIMVAILVAAFWMWCIWNISLVLGW